MVIKVDGINKGAVGKGDGKTLGGQGYQGAGEGGEGGLLQQVQGATGVVVGAVSAEFGEAMAGYSVLQGDAFSWTDAESYLTTNRGGYLAATLTVLGQQLTNEQWYDQYFRTVFSDEILAAAGVTDPCAGRPEPNRCAGVVCPEGQECNPETGQCESDNRDNAGHSFPSLQLVDDFPPSSFLAPRDQLRSQDSMGNAITSASRIKTVVDSTLLYTDSHYTRRTLDMARQGNEWAHLPALAHMWHNSAYWMGANRQSLRFDPIRYASGHYWIHSKDTLWDSDPKSELMYFANAMRVYDQSPNQAHTIFEMSVVGDNKELVYTSEGVVEKEIVRLSNWSQKISLEHQKRFPLGEHYGPPYESNNGRYIYFPYLMFGPQSLTLTPQNVEIFRDVKDLSTEEKQLEVLKENARQTYYKGRSLFGSPISQTGEFVQTYHGDSFVDLVHDCNMPFFASEAEQVDLHTHLTADISVISNYATEGYKMDQRTELNLPNIYRYSRGFVDPKDCKVSDKDLGFTSKNIESFEKIYEDYHTQFPMAVNVKFQTNQGSRIAELFKKYGMDKYFLDFIMEDGVDGQTKAFSKPGGFVHREVFGQVLDQKHTTSDRGRIRDNLISTSEGMIASLGPNTEFPDSAEATSNLNFATSNHVEGLNSRTYSEGGTLINDGVSFLHLFPTADLVWWLKTHLTIQQMSAIEDRNFPLGVFPHHEDLRPKADFTIFANELNKIIFAQKLGDLVTGDTSFYSDGDKMDPKRKMFRSFTDILNGQKAYSETIAYRVSKHRVVVRENGVRFVESEPVQNFFFFDSDSVQEINFLDSQIRYGREYEYRVYAYNVVIGNKYKYKPLDSQLKGLIADYKAYHRPYGTGPEADQERKAEFTKLRETMKAYYLDRVAMDSPPSSPPSPEYALDLEVMNKPYVAIIQVPYYKQEVLVIDRPPIFPTIDIVPYKDVPNKIRISMMANGGEYTLEPIGLKPKTESYIGDETIIAEMRKAQGNRLKIHYKYDDPPKFYEVFRTAVPPLSYNDFATAKMWTYEAFGSAVSVDHDIEPNKKYYYTFRSKDDAGISNPTEVYCVEMILVDDGMYLDIKEYEFPKPEKITKVPFRSCFMAAPSIRQRILDVGRWTMKSEGNRIGELTNALSDFKDSVDLGVEDSKAEILWGKKFKFRITSKTSGKKMDINVVFNQRKRGYEAPKEVAPPSQSFVDNCPPPGPRVFVEAEKVKEEERKKKDEAAAKKTEEKKPKDKKKKKAASCEDQCKEMVSRWVERMKHNGTQYGEEDIENALIKCMIEKGCIPKPAAKKEDLTCEELCTRKYAEKKDPRDRAILIQKCMQENGCFKDASKAEDKADRERKKKEEMARQAEQKHAEAEKKAEEEARRKEEQHRRYEEEMRKKQQAEEEAVKKAMEEAERKAKEQEEEARRREEEKSGSKKSDSKKQGQKGDGGDQDPSTCMDICRLRIRQRFGEKLKEGSREYNAFLEACLKACQDSESKYA